MLRKYSSKCLALTIVPLLIAVLVGCQEKEERAVNPVTNEEYPEQLGSLD